MVKRVKEKQTRDNMPKKNFWLPSMKFSISAVWPGLGAPVKVYRVAYFLEPKWPTHCRISQATQCDAYLLNDTQKQAF
jgi:hypothetical protein